MELNVAFDKIEYVRIKQAYTDASAETKVEVLDQLSQFIIDEMSSIMKADPMMHFKPVEEVEHEKDNI